jgi:outer membrane protein W
MIRARALGVFPDAGSSDFSVAGADLDIDNSVVPELDFTYFFNHHRGDRRRDAARHRRARRGRGGGYRRGLVAAADGAAAISLSSRPGHQAHYRRGRELHRLLQ